MEQRRRAGAGRAGRRRCRVGGGAATARTTHGEGPQVLLTHVSKHMHDAADVHEAITKHVNFHFLSPDLRQTLASSAKSHQRAGPSGRRRSRAGAASRAPSGSAQRWRPHRRTQPRQKHVHSRQKQQLLKRNQRRPLSAACCAAGWPSSGRRRKPTARSDTDDSIMSGESQACADGHAYCLRQ